MAVQTLSDSQAWAQFMKVTQAARIRNAALAAPVRGTARSASAARQTQARSATAAQAVSFAPSYRASQERPVRLVGSRFDAYA